MPIDPPIWDDIRHAFEYSDDTVAIIARRFGVTSNQIRYRVRALNWTPRPSGAEALAIANAKRSVGLMRPSYAEPLAAPERKSKRAPATGSLPHRQAIIVRLYDVIDAKLVEIERRIATDRALDQGEAERETREIGTLIKNFEKLTELSDAHDAKFAQRAAAAPATNDQEHLRQDLVRRLERIRIANRDRAAARDAVASDPREPKS